MALRAGYYGVKRRIWEALQKTVSEDTQEIADIRSEQTVLGAKNLLENTATSQSVNGVAFVVNADGTVTANNKATANATLRLNKIYNLPSGTYKYTGCPSGGGSSTYQGWIGIRNAGDTAWISSHTDTGNGVEFTVDASQTSYVQVEIEVRNNYTADDLIFKPMIRLATDPDATYTPYAMTNQQLTEKVKNYDVLLPSTTDLNDVIETGIYFANNISTNTPSGLASNYFGLIVFKYTDDNVRQMLITKDVIYTRAKGGSPAAWTSWYKYTGTAVTQAKAPEDIAVDPEISEEEPVVVKKTTRKKTTKTEEEE